MANETQTVIATLIDNKTPIVSIKRKLTGYRSQGDLRKPRKPPIDGLISDQTIGFVSIFRRQAQISECTIYSASEIG